MATYLSVDGVVGAGLLSDLVSVDDFESDLLSLFLSDPLGAEELPFRP